MKEKEETVKTENTIDCQSKTILKKKKKEEIVKTERTRKKIGKKSGKTGKKIAAKG